jgi:hypothetical protein
VAQADEGESLDVQQRQLAGYAQMNGLTIDRVFVERGVSGSKPIADRPQGAALLAALQPGDVLITPKLDRMFRSALDAGRGRADQPRRGPLGAQDPGGAAMTAEKALVVLMRRLIRTHGLAAMLDAIAEVLEAAENASLAHDGIEVRRLARRVWVKEPTGLV